MTKKLLSLYNPYRDNLLYDFSSVSVHGDSTPLKECNKIRTVVIGIGQSGMLSEFDKNKEFIK